MKTDTNGGDRYKVMAEINMIPLIDVSLVLLIIFMVMTPYLVKTQIKIDLPKAKSSEQTKYSTTMVTVQVAKNGSIFIEGQPVEAAAVEGTLKRMLQDPEKQPLMIEADKDVPFQHVVVVMDAAKRIGAAKLGVTVKQDVGKK